MNLIALDTATDACSAALWVDGDIRERFVIEPRQHTKLILNMVDSLLAEAQLQPAQLDGVLLSCGPGSFTGVRIATGVAQGIALGLDVPVALVSTLACVAQDYFNQHADDLAYTAMDARMDEIFWGVYRRNVQGLAELIGQEAVLPAEQVADVQQTGAGVGSGWAVYPEQLSQRLAPFVTTIKADVWPRAASVAQLGAWQFQLGQVVPVEQALPVYLRDKVAKKTSERNA